MREGEVPRTAVVADLLRSIRVRSSIFARPVLSAPWGFEIVDEETAFHIVTRGRCSLTFGGTGDMVALSEGDFVLLPRGGAYVIGDVPATKPVRLDRSLKTRNRGSDGVFRAGGGGETTGLICGNLRFEDVSTDLLLSILPPIIHVRKQGSGFASWLAATIEHARSELDAGHAAAEVVVARIADLLFIHAIGTYLEDNAQTASSGWLGALRDRQIGPALALLHEHPERTWTVESLADELGISRSAFAARFAQLVGEPPLRYLSRVRLNAVASRLSSSDEKMSAIATSLGYESVSGFNKAFKKRFGLTPGEYRGRFSARIGV
ncbi:MAG: AraC family transcriptional regulator [Vulcanimicrobiaceae bacterium]